MYNIERHMQTRSPRRRTRRRPIAMLLGKLDRHFLSSKRRQIDFHRRFFYRLARSCRPRHALMRIAHAGVGRYTRCLATAGDINTRFGMHYRRKHAFISRHSATEPASGFSRGVGFRGRFQRVVDARYRRFLRHASSSSPSFSHYIRPPPA